MGLGRFFTIRLSLGVLTSCCKSWVFLGAPSCLGWCSQVCSSVLGVPLVSTLVSAVNLQTPWARIPQALRDPGLGVQPPELGCPSVRDRPLDRHGRTAFPPRVIINVALFSAGSYRPRSHGISPTSDYKRSPIQHGFL